jgi:hypothetical protein
MRRRKTPAARFYASPRLRTTVIAIQYSRTMPDEYDDAATTSYWPPAALAKGKIDTFAASAAHSALLPGIDR